jgi:Domain of unknown function (DUF4160)
MPTVMRWNGYRFYFFSNEGYEPPHIHIDKDGHTAKFWLSPVLLARNIGYSPRDLRILEAKVVEERSRFMEAWYEYFSRRT